MKEETARYIRRIRNREKQVYADWYAQHRSDKDFRDLPSFANPTGYMARQAVRMEIQKLEQGS